MSARGNLNFRVWKSYDMTSVKCMEHVHVYQMRLQFGPAHTPKTKVLFAENTVNTLILMGLCSIAAPLSHLESCKS